MILECPSCTTRYEIPSQVPPEGRRVRCAKCGHIWIATAQSEPPAPPPPPPAPEPTVGDDDFVFQDRTPESDKAAESAPAAMAAARAPVEPPQPDPEPEPAPEPPPQASAEAAAPPEPEPAPPPSPPENAPAAEEPGIAFAEWKGDEAAPEAAAAAATDADASFDFDEVEFGDEAAPEEEAQEEDEPLLPPPALARNREAQIAVGKSRRFGKFPAGLVAGWSVLVLAVLAALGGLYVLRTDVVRAFPAMAGLYDLMGTPVNVRGLDFEDVQYAWAVDDGRLILEVRGEVVNVTDAPVMVPTVTFNLRNEEQADVYQWAADIRTEPLPGGERSRFVARIPHPPKTVRSLQVRFAKQG